MNKKTVSWAASVMMAGSLAVAPFAGAQMMGSGQQETMQGGTPQPTVMGGQMPGGSMNKMGPGMMGGQPMGMGGGMGQMGPMMGGEEPDMFSPEAIGFDIDAVLVKAANKNVLPPLCQPQLADIKAGDEGAIDDCLDAMEEEAIELIDQNEKMTGQQISDALGLGKTLKAGGVSQAKRVRAVAQVKVAALEAQDATDMAQNMEQEHEANVAQRQEERKQSAAMRQNTMGQMGGQQGMMMGGMNGGMQGQAGMMQPGSMGMGGQMGQGRPMQGGMMPPMGGAQGQMGGAMQPSMMMGGMGMPKTADEAAKMYEQMNPGKTYTPEMREQFNNMQKMSGSVIPGSFAGSAQGGMQPPMGQGGPMMGGMNNGGMPGQMNGMMPPMMGQPGMPGGMGGNQGGFVPPMTGGSMGNQPPMMMGGMQGGMMPPPGGQMAPPPQGGMPSGQPMPPPPTASAIGTLGAGFWRGFFDFLGF